MAPPAPYPAPRVPSPCCKLGTKPPGPWCGRAVLQGGVRAWGATVPQSPQVLITIWGQQRGSLGWLMGAESQARPLRDTKATPPCWKISSYVLWPGSTSLACCPHCPALHAGSFTSPNSSSPLVTEKKSASLCADALQAPPTSCQHPVPSPSTALKSSPSPAPAKIRLPESDHILPNRSQAGERNLAARGGPSRGARRAWPRGERGFCSAALCSANTETEVTSSVRAENALSESGA